MPYAGVFINRIKRTWLLLAALLPAVAIVEAADGYEPVEERPRDIRRLAEFAADVRDRMRRVIFTPYPVSAAHGVVRNFVHVSDGTAVLSRVDLVVDGPMPIVFRRAYHSDRTRSSDFGEGGWHLTMAERVIAGRGGTFSYVHGNGATLEFDRQGRFRSLIESHLSDVASIALSGSVIELRTRNGRTKQFGRAGRDYRLQSVQDAYGNVLEFRYGQGGLLRRVDSSSGAWLTISRDEAGRIKAVEDSNKRLIQFAYDAVGRLKSSTDPRRADWLYAYDGANRITASTTPNDLVDVEFRYDTSGRVLMSRSNGTRSFFDYIQNRTLVTDSQGVVTAYTAGASGITSEVVNGLGTTTKLETDKKGRPSELLRNSVPVVTYVYAKNDSAPEQVTVISQSGDTYLIKYDGLGRVRQTVAPAAENSYEVVRYGRALLPELLVYGDGTRDEAKFDSQGALSALYKRNGASLAFEKTASKWLVTDPQARELELSFDQVGRLQGVKTPSNVEMSYEYNDVGLRERTQLSYGAEVQYRYDASGSLYYSASGYRDREIPTHTYSFGDDHSIREVRGSMGDIHLYAYSPTGLLTSLRSSTLSRDLVFHYDDFGRLTSAEFEGSIIVHRYAAGEPDVVAQAGVRRLPVHNQQREIEEFPSQFDATMTRIQPSSLGLLTYDDVSHELAFTANPTRWKAMSPVTQSIYALQIETLLADDVAGIRDFNIPSNRLFTPPEYWSVNCCTCYCENGVTCNPY